MMKRLTILVFLAAFSASTVLAADDACLVPMANWQPKEAVARMAKEKGWALRRIKIDDGCYEIYGLDAKGRHIEVTLNPGTLKIIKIEKEREEEEDD